MTSGTAEPEPVPRNTTAENDSPSNTSLKASEAGVLSGSFDGAAAGCPPQNHHAAVVDVVNAAATNDVRVLLRAIQLVACLALMEASEYEAALWSHELPLHSPVQLPCQQQEGGGPSSSSNSSVDSVKVMHEIQAMQREYDLETNTDLPMLVRSVARLQSNQRCLQMELEASEGRVTQLQLQLDESNSRHEKLQAAHQELRRQLSQAKSDKRVLKDAFRRYQATNASQQRRLDKLQEVNDVLQLWVHEDRLLPSSKRARIVVSRSQVDEEEDFEPSHTAWDKRKPRSAVDEDATEVTEASTLTPPSTPRRVIACRDDARSVPSLIHTDSDDDLTALPFPSMDGGSVFSNDYSVSSLDECSTRTASNDAASPCASPLPWTSSSTPPTPCGRSTTPAATSPVPYTLTYEVGTKMGLRVRPVELDSDASNFTTSPTRAAVRRPLISTEELMMAPNLAQNATMATIPSGEQRDDSHHGSSSSDSTGSKTFSIGLILGSKKSTASQGARPRQAFLVCGYTEADAAYVSSTSSSSSFHRVAHSKPPIGTRIVAINGRPVDDTWTFAQFLDHMRQADGSRTAASQLPNGGSASQLAERVPHETSCKYYTVTFRNDLLTDRLREHLAMPSRGTPSAMASPLAVSPLPSCSAASFDQHRDDRVSSHQASMESSCVNLTDGVSQPPPATASHSSLLGSISSSFWGKAAELYAN